MHTGGSDTMTMTSLFLLGFLGSGHCVGMCGPLVVAFPGRGRWVGHLAYNLGRILTYCGVGALLGSVGPGLARFGAGGSFVWTVRIQVGLSLVAALFLGLFGLIKLGLLAEPKVLANASPTRIPGFNAMQRLAVGAGGGRVGPTVGLFALGVALGLLPCGLSFAAFSRTLGASGPGEGAAMMLAFGAGTLPSLLVVGLSASQLSARFRRLSDLIAAMLMIGMSASLLVAVAV